MKTIKELTEELSEAFYSAYGSNNVTSTRRVQKMCKDIADLAHYIDAKRKYYSPDTTPIQQEEIDQNILNPKKPVGRPRKN